MTTATYACDIDSYRANGYFITPVLYSEGQLAKLRDEAHRLWQQVIDQAPPDKLEKTKRLAFVGCLHERSDIFAKFLRAKHCWMLLGR